jgi:hypothetical protein
MSMAWQTALSNGFGYLALAHKTIGRGLKNAAAATQIDQEGQNYGFSMTITPIYWPIFDDRMAKISSQEGIIMALLTTNA